MQKSILFLALCAEPVYEIISVNGTQYADPELLEVNTLENAIYVGMKNDLSFLIASRLYLYEHQSTVNPNLPLRFLLYISDLFSDIVKDLNLYGSRKVKIPPPRFLIFYNGEKEQPDVQVLKLSELFSLPEDHPALELEAVMLNINKGHNRKLMEACRSLRDYAEYTDRVRRYAKEMELRKAVERAVAECIEEGILTEFLKKNRAKKKRAGKRVTVPVWRKVIVPAWKRVIVLVWRRGERKFYWSR